MNKFGILTFLLASSVAFAAQEAWLNLPPQNMQSTAKEIPREKFFEVVASKQAVAELDLSQESVIELQQNEASYYGQLTFQCPEPNKLYLVRAVYENGGTGAYSVKQSKNNLIVSHFSLGKASGPHRSALVVCLGFKPEKVFHEIGGAM